MLKIRLLGNPGVELDGQKITFSYKRADALLYYMVIRRSTTRQELISLLWESCDETTGLKNLRNTLYTLKKTLGGDFLISPQKSQVMVNPQWELDCDYDRFMRDGDVSAYGGAFLQGLLVKNAFSYEEWISRTREKLQDQYLSCLEDRAKSALEAGTPDQAAYWAGEYLREDPLDERMTAFLMERHGQMHQYAKAAQLYQRLKNRLADDLGVDPMESTTVLYYEIMNQWNDVAQTSTGQGRVPVPIGRETACAALRAAIESFADGGSRRCSQLLLGGAGSGKSNLVSHFKRESDLTPFLVLSCTCLQSEEQIALAPWDRIMMSVLEFTQEKGLPVPLHIRARLGQVFSVFREEGEAAPAIHSLRQADRGLEDSIILLMAAVSRRKKIVLIVEDIQWMDPDSLSLVDSVLRRLEGGGLMAIITCRDDCRPLITQMLERAEMDGLLREQKLYPLTKEQTREVLVRELGKESAERLAEQFYEETGGNLYLLMELVQAYRRSGDVETTIGTLGDILMERLIGLKESAVQVAELISVFHKEAPAGTLLELMDRDDLRLTNGLEELLGRGLIEERINGETTAYCFTHQTIRELVYDRLTFFQRQPLHLRIAELLGGGKHFQDSDPCRRVAWHFQLAGDSLRALEYRIQALELESQRSCEPFPLQVGDETPWVPPEELEQEAQRALRELAAMRRAGQDAGILLRLEQRVALIRGRVALFQGHSTEGIEILGTLSSTGEEGWERSVKVRACYLLASSALSRQEVDLAERYTATGTRLLERSGDILQQAQFQRLRGNCFCLRGAYNKSSYYLLEAVDEVERELDSHGQRIQLAAACYDYGRLSRQRHDYAGACSDFKKALALLEGEPWPGCVWIYVHYGRTAFAMEDHPRAKEMFRLGYQAVKQTGELWGATAAAAFTALYQVLDEEYDQAAQSLTDAQEYDKTLDSPLEGAILCFVSMRIQQKLEVEQRTGTPVGQLLTASANSYARQGIRKLAGVSDVFEAEMLSRSIRDGIAMQESYRVEELYSRNRHFMTE